MPLTLVLRRATGHRPGDRGPHDYDVLAGGREVGRIYRINAATEIWSGGISFMLTGRKSYGDAPTRDDALVAFRAAYVRWLEEQPKAWLVKVAVLTWRSWGSRKIRPACPGFLRISVGSDILDLNQSPLMLVNVHRRSTSILGPIARSLVPQADLLG